MKKFLIILGYLALIIVLILGLFLWLDYLELVRLGRLLNPIRSMLNISLDMSEEDEGTDILYLENLRVAKERQTLEIYEDSLDQRERSLGEAAQELLTREEELSRRETDLSEKEKTLNQRIDAYENRRTVIEKNAIALRNMPPENAVQILGNYDDQLLIDTLRISEEISNSAGEVSIVPLWLSLLPSERAAAVQRKMAIKPEN